MPGPTSIFLSMEADVSIKQFDVFVEFPGGATVTFSHAVARAIARAIDDHDQGVCHEMLENSPWGPGAKAVLPGTGWQLDGHPVTHVHGELPCTDEKHAR